MMTKLLKMFRTCVLRIWKYFILLSFNQKLRLLCGLCSVVIIITLVLSKKEVKFKRINKRMETTELLMDTVGCQIPYFNPFHPDLAEFFGTSRNIVQCKDTFPITYQDNQFLKINRSVLLQNFSHCTYEVIKRLTDDKNVIFLDPVIFQRDVNMTDEFVRVVCYDNQDWRIYSNYHAFIIPNRTTTDKIQRFKDTYRAADRSKPDHLNVMMIGVDSLSRLNLIAKMPKTRSFLLNTLKAVELEGYTKIADNSFPNVVALLTGKFSSEEYERLNITFEDYYDGFNTLFKSFSQKGYITLFGEDQAEFGSFNPEGTGFVEKPTDFYLRPFALAMNQDMSVWNNLYCVVNRPETNIILDYSLEFWKKYPDIPKFSYSFTSRLTHDSLLSLSTADEYHYNNLVRIHRNGYLDNTVLVFFADHGFRGGSLLDTDYGQIQTRMPMMHFAFPKWFPSKYPKLYSNIVSNKKRITAPFDIHATIMDIRNNFQDIPRSNSKSKKRGISLFDEIPKTRICDDAGIIPHWCVCKKRVLTTDIKDPFVRNAGIFVVQHIREVILKDYPKCSKLHLSGIQSASVYTTKVGITKDQFQSMLRSEKRSDEMYFINIVFLTTPGGGEFEATVKHIQGEYYTTVDSITRLNRYGSDGRCIDYNYIRPLCHCSWFWW